jgi:hypothetical protein
MANSSKAKRRKNKPKLSNKISRKTLKAIPIISLKKVAISISLEARK